jgi:hypothetical protein
VENFATSIAGVVDTGGKNLLAVSTTPEANCHQYQ